MHPEIKTAFTIAGIGTVAVSKVGPCGVAAKQVVFQRAKRHGMADTPQHGPAGNAHFQIAPELQRELLAVEVGPCGIFVAG